MIGPIDITGQRFGKLTAARRTGRHSSKGVEWLLVCDCGKTTTSIVASLRRGSPQSCGCVPPGLRRPDLTGMRFGKLTVLGLREQRSNGGGLVYFVRCDCGTSKAISAVSMRRAGVKSCGAQACSRPRPVNVMVECACGCGVKIWKFRTGVPSSERAYAPRHGSKSRLWQPREIALLKSLYRTMSIDDLAKLLKRPRPAVYWQAYNQGITKGKSGDWESLSRASKRLGVNRDTLKARLLLVGVKSGRVSGVNGSHAIHLRVSHQDLQRAMGSKEREA